MDFDFSEEQQLFKDSLSRLPGWSVRRSTCFVLSDDGPSLDPQVLESVLKNGPRYVGGVAVTGVSDHTKPWGKFVGGQVLGRRVPMSGLRGTMGVTPRAR